MEPDFSGWATKANLKCSDGRTIMPDAFKHMDGKTVPLVWQHGHKDPENVLGHAVLTAKPEGVWADAYLNATPKGKSAKVLVQHKDVSAMSIWANQLVERAGQVFHGVIREVSLVLSGANPGALIENIAHDAFDVEDEDQVALVGFALQHDDTQVPEEKGAGDGEVPEEKGENAGDGTNEGGEEVVEHATAQEVYDTLDEEQKQLVHYMIGAALEASKSSAGHSETNDEGDLNHQEGNDDMSRNIFEQNAGGSTVTEDRYVLTHSDVEEIKENWKRGGSMRQAVEQFALSHGIENIESLFPDPKSMAGDPQLDKRRTEWVDGVLNGVKNTPFSRIKTLWADITHEEARARGYIKGNLKKEEFFGLTKRTTRPTTVYKKQKLDRDDILDATELDVVAFMKAEMRLMLAEECARAILIGDGRPVEDPNNAGQPNPDKIKDPQGTVDGEGIRSILHDHELFAATVNVEIANDASAYQNAVEQIMLAMEFYKGSGSPTFYTTLNRLNRMLLSKDQFGRRLWRTREELATEMGVAAIVPVEVMEQEADLLGIIVNLQDYNVGTDRGGETNMFDDFDIDYNQYKYLIETRFSGALVKLRSALVIKIQPAANTLVDPVPAPTYDAATNVVTIPTATGVIYKNADTNATLVAGAQAALAVGATLNVQAVADTGYYFATNQEDFWSFTGE